MTESGFLAAIRAAPDDNTPRLVYADWLEEQGEVRQAEYIRAAIGFSEIKDEHDSRRQALFDREQELERIHSEPWRQRFAGYLPEPLRSWCWSELHFTRGLPGSVNAEVSRFAQDAEALMQVFPIRSASLRVQRFEDIAQLGSLAAFQNCSWLSLHAPPELGPPAIQAIVKSPYLGGLKSLQLFNLMLGDEGLVALAEAAERFPCLEMLELTRTGVTGVGVAALSGCTLMTHLRSLWLRENAIGWEGLRALANAKAPVLEELWLPDTRLGDVGTTLAGAHWPALWRLDLDNSGLTASSVSALLRAEWFHRLRDLSLRGLSFSRSTEMGSTDPRPVGLRSLSLGSSTLSDAGLLRLLKPHRFPELRSLWVSDSKVGDEAIAALTAHPCDQLVDLYLMDNQIGSIGAWCLITSPHLPALRRLDLGRNRIGARSINEKSEPATEPHLISLDLARNPMTTEVARILLSRGELARLEELKLSYSNMGPQGGQILANLPTTSLKNLLVCGTGLEDEGVIDLLKAGFVESLRDLSLQQVNLQDKGLSALVLHGEFASLLSLRLDRNPLGPKTGALLASAPWLSQLKSLQLSDTAIGDEGVAALAACPAVGQLGFLGLNAVGLTATGARALLDSPHFSNDIHVHLAGNDQEIQDRFGSALAQRFKEVDYERHPHIDMAW